MSNPTARTNRSAVLAQWSVLLTLLVSFFRDTSVGRAGVMIGRIGPMPTARLANADEFRFRMEMLVCARLAILVVRRGGREARCRLENGRLIACRFPGCERRPHLPSYHPLGAAVITCCEGKETTSRAASHEIQLEDLSSRHFALRVHLISWSWPKRCIAIGLIRLIQAQRLGRASTQFSAHDHSRQSASPH